MGAAVAALGVFVASSPKWGRKVWVFDLAAPLSFAGPIALIVLYQTSSSDAANAGTSVIIACAVFMATRLGLWALVHAVAKNSKMTFVAGRVTLRAVSAGPDADTLLAPLLEGAWLGKPAPRNPRKLRFFQLSHDGSTLRWGWRKFVRLYYVQDVTYAPDALSLTMSFVLDPELTVKFPDGDTFEAWRRGLDHLLVVLMAPGEPGAEDAELVEGDKLENDPMALEEGLLGKLGTRVRRLGGWRL